MKKCLGDMGGGENRVSGALMSVGRRLLCSYILLFVMACSSPTASDPQDPRQFIWSVTYLSYPGSFQTTMRSVWGSSSKNVYVCGHSDLLGRGTMFHYDGKIWRPVSLPVSGIDLEEITGFGPADIWAVGAKIYGSYELSDSALVLHFDGSSWRDVLPSRMGTRMLTSVWGTSSSDIYFGSADGKVIRYDGTTWTLDTLENGLSIATVGGNRDRMFAFGFSSNGTAVDSAMSYTRVSGDWQLLDVQEYWDFLTRPRFGMYGMFSPQVGTHYSCASRGVLKWVGSAWTTIFEVQGGILGLAGTEEQNIIAVGTTGVAPIAYHWNGADWAEIGPPQGSNPIKGELSEVWTDGSEAFIVGYDGSRSFILHGW